MKKPVFAIENGRWGTVYKSEQYKDVYHAGFRVKFDSSGKLQNLTIKTDSDYLTALSYSIDGAPEEVCDKDSWANALLKAANQGGYSAHLPKEFELHVEESESYYALTEKSKAEICKEYKEFINLFRYSFTAGDSIALPNTQPGPKFKNDVSVLHSTSSIT
jgi:hypothetical protein